MTPDLINEATAGLLLLTLFGVLVVALGFVFLVFRYRKQNPQLGWALVKRSHLSPVARWKFSGTVFDTPCRWLAIKSSNPEAVQAALGLHHPTPCLWSESVSNLGLSHLFIAPPIQGWILVVGPGLPDPADDVDKCYHLIRRLSRAIGQVQFFSVNHALNHHAWAWARSGQILRSYAWAGETLWNEGSRTHTEKELGLKCSEYAESSDEIGWASSESNHSNTEKVYFLAARWSLDPLSVDESMLPSPRGIAGDFTQPTLS